MKLLHHGFFILCCLLFASGCTNSQQDGTKAVVTQHLTSFKGFPPGFEGCTCYFSGTEKEFQNEQYIFVSDLEQKAFITVNGKQINLKLDSTTRVDNSLDDSDYSETYSNGYYTLKMDVKFGGNTGDEVWWNTGIMTLYFKGVEIDRREFVGECGC